MKITKTQLRQIIEEEINALAEEEEGEGYMAVSQLEYMKEIIPKIQQYVNDESDLEEWIESKLTLAKEYIETVYGHFEGTDKPKVRGGVMGLYAPDVFEEVKEDCFAKGKYKTFKGKSKCIQRTKDLSQEQADAYVASVLRDMGEIKEEDEKWISKAVPADDPDKGKFSAAAKKAGMSTCAYARKIMKDPNASTLQKRRANFALNVACKEK